MWYKVIDGKFIDSIGEGTGGISISQEEYISLNEIILMHPSPPEGYTYKLRADTIEWELAKLPVIVDAPPEEDEALTRYINEQTGADDTDLVSAAETLITKLTEE